MANAVKSSPVMRVPQVILTKICGYTDRFDCLKTRLVCKAWSRIFTPYNAMQYSGKMNVDMLSITCSSRDLPGNPYDSEHAKLRTCRAYRIIQMAELTAFTSLELAFPLEKHAWTESQLFSSRAFSSLTHISLPSIPSRDLLQSIRESSPQLTSMHVGSRELTDMHELGAYVEDIGAEALCQQLNAFESLKETTIYSPRSDDALEKLQKLNSLTNLHIERIGTLTTGEGLRHLADGYPSLRMLSLSGRAPSLQEDGLLARPWVQRFVELESIAFRLLDLRLGGLTQAETVCVATQFLSKASKLQALEFQNSNLDPKCVEQLPKCPSLTALSLVCDNSGITESTMQSTAQCANLRFLSVKVPDDLGLEKALQYLVGHKTIEDLTLARQELRFCNVRDLLQAVSCTVVSVAKKMPALRVLEIPQRLHPYVVKQLPQHNVYPTVGPSRDKYKLLPEKAESKRDDNK